MSHDKVCGICQPNKCLVEVDTKENTDVVKNKVSTLESTVSTLSSSVGGFDSRIKAVENEVNGALNCASVTASGKITGNGGIAGTTGTFSGAVTASKFNGVVLKSSGTITVTPKNNGAYYYVPHIEHGGVLILPPVAGCVYSGSIRLLSNSATYCYYADGVSGQIGTGSAPTITLTKGTPTVYTFSNIPYLIIGGPYVNYAQYEDFTLS